MNRGADRSFSFEPADVLFKLIGGLCDQLNDAGIVRQSRDFAHVHKPTFHAFDVNGVHARKTNAGLLPTFRLPRRLAAVPVRCRHQRLRYATKSQQGPPET